VSLFRLPSLILLAACVDPASGTKDTSGGGIVDSADTGTDTGIDTGTDTGIDTGDDTDTADTQPTLVAVAVTPDRLDFATTRGEETLRAIGTWSDGSTTDVSTTCSWSTDDGAVAQVHAGVLHPLDVGSAIASCSVPEGLVGSAAVTVGAIAPATNDEVVFNEVLADVPTAADPNADGVADASDDEFVELVNAGRYTVDIGGYTLWDASNTTARHVFPSPTVLRPGQAIVVFGGGAVGVSGANCTAGAVINDDVGLQLGLALNNEGDTVSLRDTLGGDISTVTYDGAIEDASVVRTPDIDGAFTHHLYVSGSVGAYSPCTFADGAAFPEPSARW
jgi:hypothetical protein